MDTGMELLGNVGIFQKGAYLKVHTSGGLENVTGEGNFPEVETFLKGLGILARYRVDVGGSGRFMVDSTSPQWSWGALGSAGYWLSPPFFLPSILLTGARILALPTRGYADLW